MPDIKLVTIVGRRALLELSYKPTPCIHIVITGDPREWEILWWQPVDTGLSVLLTAREENQAA